MTYIAFVTKGIEEVCAEELRNFNGLSIQNVSQKSIIFEYSENPADLINLRTIDDIGLVVGELTFDNEVTETDNYLPLNDLKPQIETLRQYKDFIQSFRNVNDTFSVTVSIFKNSKYKQDDLKDQLSKYLQDELKLSYTTIDHTNFDVRFNIEENNCLISVRLFPEPMFKRKYGHSGSLGALRSTIAAAILFTLTKDTKDLKIVDNFCGSGTFLCEGLILGHNIFGGDIDPHAIKQTEENILKVSNSTHQILKQDAADTRWQSNFFDVAVSNYPWNKQIKSRNIEKLYETSIKEYARILKPDGKIGLVGMYPEKIRKVLMHYFPNKKIQEYQLGYLGQTPSVVMGE